MRSATRITMTIRDVYHAMRAAGISCNTQMISDGIASGVYPFGRVVNEGETGRRSFEIYKVDFYAWLETKIPKQEGTLQLMRHIG